MYGKVGAQSLSSGSSGPLRLNEQGSLVTHAYGGKYAEAAKKTITNELSKIFVFNKYFI